MKLYELTSNYNNLLDRLYDDIDEQTIIDTLDSIECAIEEKAANIAKINAQIDYNIDVLDAEIKRLQHRKETMKNRQTSIRNYLFAQLKKLGKTKIETDIYTISIRKNPAKLIIDNPEKINASFLTVIPEHTEINNAALKEALKTGEFVDGAHLEQGESLQIK